MFDYKRDSRLASLIGIRERVAIKPAEHPLICFEIGERFTLKGITFEIRTVQLDPPSITLEQASKST